MLREPYTWQGREPSCLGWEAPQFHWGQWQQMQHLKGVTEWTRCHFLWRLAREWPFLSWTHPEPVSYACSLSAFLLRPLILSSSLTVSTPLSMVHLFSVLTLWGPVWRSGKNLAFKFGLGFKFQVHHTLAVGSWASPPWSSGSSSVTSQSTRTKPLIYYESLAHSLLLCL